MYNFLYCLLSFFIASLAAAQSITVPIAGNTYSSLKDGENKNLAKQGIINWQNANEKFTTYIRVTRPGSIRLTIVGSSPAGTSQIAVSALSHTKKIKLNTQQKEYAVGEWLVKDTGYIAFTFSALQKTGCCFADILHIKLSGSAINENSSYVKNNEGNFYYWGRRGASTHLNYQLPANVHAEWFYNEVTVPKGDDIIGSYFMANGFAEGYFGMQVNAANERRILFSVWSPFQTDNPKDIPQEQKIILLKKGDDVYTGEFGNEGSGGQSFLKYNWEAGVAQKFLLHAVPSGAAHTVYTAYFFDNKNKNWKLIASFKRPKKATYLTRLHSFLENFNPLQGDSTRQVYFTNQWVKSNTGAWHELTNARFSADNTARVGYRKDYAGGSNANGFYLKGFGFFKEFTPIGKLLQRSANNTPPAIDFENLP